MSDDFIAHLVESYGTREALAEELVNRIDECLALRKEVERQRKKKYPAELRARIDELEAQLAAVNRRLGSQNEAALGLRPSEGKHS